LAAIIAVAVAIPIGVDAAITRLSPGVLFLLTAALTAVGLWVFFPGQKHRPRKTVKTRAAAATFGLLFVVSTTISALAVEGFLKIAIGVGSLVPLTLTYFVLRRGD
jgi:hypothetical protein